MTPESCWAGQSTKQSYIPESFPTEGFIHCTDDLDELLAVGNRYYRLDSRSWIALEIECDAVPAPIVYEDEAKKFPHIYGPLPVTAVRRIATLVRNDEGVFVAIACRPAE